MRVVTEASEPAGEIDIERATKAAERARERLEVRAVADEPISFDRFRAQASLRRALMRRFVANKARQ